MYGKLEKLLETKAPVFELLSREGVRSLLEGESQWPWYGQLMTGPQTAAYLLQLNFWLESYGIDLII
jgi:asparagine synthase (glutamine-hydrolysing)